MGLDDLNNDLVLDQFVPKSWGYEKIIVNGPYCGKILHIAKGRRFSLHYHKLKRETFFVSSGSVKLLYFNDVANAHRILSESGPQALLDICDIQILGEGDIFHVEPGLLHMAIGLRDSDIVEFSTTDYPNDSYRLIKGD
jgi:quercetin dioxygenase-like cupin family protein